MKNPKINESLIIGVDFSKRDDSTSLNVLAVTRERYLRMCILMIEISGIMTKRFYIFAMVDSARFVQMNVIIQLTLTMLKTSIRNLACM